SFPEMKSKFRSNCLSSITSIDALVAAVNLGSLQCRAPCRPLAPLTRRFTRRRSHSVPMNASRWSLDDILDALANHHQRATYGAVGHLLHRPPFYLMQGRPRDRRHSWIVSKETGLPSGYAEAEMDPALREKEE